LEGFSTATAIRCVGVAKFESTVEQAFYKVDDDSIEKRYALAIAINFDFALLFDNVIGIRGLGNVEGVLVATTAAVTDPDTDAFFVRG
jgi:hypothetical protein